MIRRIRYTGPEDTEERNRTTMENTQNLLLDFSHVADNLDASERDLTVYRVVPNVVEFYQTLNVGGNSRLKYKYVKQEWEHEVL